MTDKNFSLLCCLSLIAHMSFSNILDIFYRLFTQFILFVRVCQALSQMSSTYELSLVFVGTKSWANLSCLKEFWCVGLIFHPKQ